MKREKKKKRDRIIYKSLNRLFHKVNRVRKGKMIVGDLIELSIEI